MKRKSLAKLERIRQRQRDRASARFRQYCFEHEKIAQDYRNAILAVASIGAGQANAPDELERLSDVIEHCRSNLVQSTLRQQELQGQLQETQIKLRRSEILHEQAKMAEKTDSDRLDQQQCDESNNHPGRRK